MEEILASIRRIIADEDTGRPKPAAAAPPPPPPPPPAPKPAVVAARPVPPPAPPPPPKPVPAPANNQSDIDAMLADIDSKTPPKPAAVVPPPTDILDLTEAMATPQAPPPGPAAAFRTIDAASDVFFAEAAPEQRPPERSERPMPPPAASDYQGLISNATVSAVDSAFNSLAHTVLGNNARTLEDLVKEMLRPMLKGWLDDNLPNMVERIVRAEIERVSRGRS